MITTHIPPHLPRSLPLPIYQPAILSPKPPPRQSSPALCGLAERNTILGDAHAEEELGACAIEHVGRDAAPSVRFRCPDACDAEERRGGRGRAGDGRALGKRRRLVGLVGRVGDDFACSGNLFGQAQPDAVVAVEIEEGFEAVGAPVEASFALPPRSCLRGRWRGAWVDDAAPELLVVDIGGGQFGVDHFEHFPDFLLRAAGTATVHDRNCFSVPQRAFDGTDPIQAGVFREPFS